MVRSGSEAWSRREALGASALGISALVLPSASAAASAPTGPVSFDTFSVEAVEDRTVRVTWDASGFTDTIQYRVEGDGDEDWVSVEGRTSPADVVTQASWGSAVTSVTYEFRVRTSSGGVSLDTATRTVTSRAAATGGDVIDLITDDGNAYRVHEFTSTAAAQDFVLTYPRAVEYLIVAGGGGGGKRHGGGGGGGGVLTGTTVELPAGTYEVTVGGGGAGATGTDDPTPATNGGPSSWNLTAASLATLTADGGGAGGSFSTVTLSKRDGTDGGSGGGAATGFGTVENPNGVPGAGTPGQGNDGGTPAAIGRYPGTGGGGADGAGLPNGGTDNKSGGDGGVGLQSGIRGITVDGASPYYGGGGGGAGEDPSNPAGVGGLGGGGAGSVENTPATNGTAGTGGGGGGARAATPTDPSGTGGDGGSGIVILRYRLTPAA